MSYITKTIYLLKNGENYYTDRPWDNLWSECRSDAHEFKSTQDIEKSILSRSDDNYDLTEGEFKVDIRIKITNTDND